MRSDPFAALRAKWAGAAPVHLQAGVTRVTDVTAVREASNSGASAAARTVTRSNAARVTGVTGPASAQAQAPVTRVTRDKPSDVTEEHGPESAEICDPGPIVTSVTRVTSSERQAEADCDIFEERAALIEDGASVPRAWAEGLASLDLAAPPAGFTPALWQQVVEDGARFLDRWGSEAAELGWSALDVFGVHPVVPTSRFDAMGLVPLIRGGEVVAIAAERATICTPHGGQLTYLRRPRPGAVAFWDLAYQGRLAREARG